MLDGKTLPLSPDIPAATIGIMIIGPKNLSEKTLPGFLHVQREQVQRALLWLKNNNLLYQDITICDDHLQQLPINAVLCQLIESARYSSDTSALEQERSGYVIANDEDHTEYDDQQYEIGIPVNCKGEFRQLFSTKPLNKRDRWTRGISTRYLPSCQYNQV